VTRTFLAFLIHKLATQKCSLARPISHVPRSESSLSSSSSSSDDGGEEEEEDVVEDAASTTTPYLAAILVWLFVAESTSWSASQVHTFSTYALEDLLRCKPI
jgi:hypothetical protein